MDGGLFHLRNLTGFKDFLYMTYSLLNGYKIIIKFNKHNTIKMTNLNSDNTFNIFPQDFQNNRNPPFRC